MSLTQFQFFSKKEQIIEEEFRTQFAHFQDVQLTCSTSGRKHLMFGDSHGYVHLLNAKFQLSGFRAYGQSVSYIQYMKELKYLITIGEDDESAIPVLKVWVLEKLGKNNKPLCQRTTKLQNGSKVSPVSAFAIMKNMSQLAVGFANGSVILLRGNITKDRFTKQKLVHEGAEPITGLGFVESSKSATVLFIVTTRCTFSYVSGAKESKDILDDYGGDAGCSTMCPNQQEMIIARKEALYFYKFHEKGYFYPCEGDKRFLTFFNHYVVVVTSTNSHPPTMSLSIFDFKNKFLAFTGAFEIIQHVLVEWGCLIVFTDNGKVFRLEEFDISAKLEVLFKQNSYPLAVALAKESSCDNAFISSIERRYGDYLYIKGDYEGAMEHYLHTIGFLDASYVIRKFLDAQRVHNLTTYLQELHERSCANSNHTTLLLTCYTKLKDIRKLESFIKSENSLNFDVETAIKVCRQANFHEYALYLAKRFNQYDMFLKIQLEDVHNYDEAYDYISQLSVEEIKGILKKHGITLVSNIPEKTTNLLTRICHEDVEFIHLFVSKPTWLINFLEHFIMGPAESCANSIYNTLLELYLYQRKEIRENETLAVELASKAMMLMQGNIGKYDQDHALLLCQMYHFVNGILFLYEHMEMYRDILQYHIDHKDFEKVTETCARYGEKDPILWTKALSFFATKDFDCRKEIVELLQMIEERNAISPLKVIQVLSSNSTVTLSVIKDFILRRMNSQVQIIEEDTTLIENYRKESDQFKKEIEEIENKMTVFQATKCSACSALLELPAVHFFCKHAYHQRCLNDKDSECPLCAPENSMISDLRAVQLEHQVHPDRFFRKLKEADDGFQVISNYFAQDMFSNVKENIEKALT